MKKRLLLVVGLCACGARTPLSETAPDAPCPAEPPTCVLPSEQDPCGAPSVVAAACDARTHAWACPTGARVYERAAEAPSVCLPFHGASGVRSLGAWGLAGLSRVPTDDGRCLWIADSATFSDGTVARNVAFEPDPTLPFGTCPVDSITPPRPIVALGGGDDPSILVQINGGYRLGGATHVLYRLFRVEPDAVFGGVELGGGVARWDPRAGQIAVPSPETPFPWGGDLDLGDAQLVAADGEHAFVWGCARPMRALTQGCELARLDAQDHIELFSKSGSWLTALDASKGAVVFHSGTWSSSVVAADGGFRHVYVGDFGGALESDTSAVVTGPWAPGPTLAACDLPADDPKAFCAGPTVHGEVSDPTRPGELAVTYGVGSTKTSSLTPPSGNPDDYWPRLVWLP